MENTKAQKQAVITMVAFRKAKRAIIRNEGRVWLEYGIMPVQFSVMERLYVKGDLHVGELMNELLSTPGNMTVVIRNMERDGYIIRKKDKNDKRSFIISLSEKGRALIKEILPRHAVLMEKIWGVLTSEEQKDLTKILKKIYKGEEKNNG